MPDVSLLEKGITYTQWEKTRMNPVVLDWDWRHQCQFRVVCTCVCTVHVLCRNKGHKWAYMYSCRCCCTYKYSHIYSLALPNEITILITITTLSRRSKYHSLTKRKKSSLAKELQLELAKLQSELGKYNMSIFMYQKTKKCSLNE